MNRIFRTKVIKPLDVINPLNVILNDVKQTRVTVYNLHVFTKDNQLWFTGYQTGPNGLQNDVCYELHPNNNFT